tara:strand:+ start:558 stop:863 length:306 start_codon:yes stop_codon:yes gene_type:complete
MDTISVYKLEWGGPSIMTCNNNDGLWINNNKIAIHLPHFIKNNPDYCKLSYYQILDKLYINYKEGELIEKVKFSFYALNDIVLSNSPWNYLKKANIYIESL